MFTNFPVHHSRLTHEGGKRCEKKNIKNFMCFERSEFKNSLLKQTLKDSKTNIDNFRYRLEASYFQKSPN